MRNMSSWAIKNPIPPLMLFVLLTAIGTLSFFQMKITQMPDISVPFVQVIVSQPGGAPTEIETQVTQKIEGAVAGIGYHVRPRRRIPPCGTPSPDLIFPTR